MGTATPLQPGPLGDAHEAERRAFNRAFRELGLNWYWEVADYRELFSLGDAQARVSRYVELRHPELLTAYDATFIANMVNQVAAQVQGEYSQCAVAPAPGRGWSPGSHSVDFVA